MEGDFLIFSKIRFVKMDFIRTTRIVHFVTFYHNLESPNINHLIFCVSNQGKMARNGIWSARNDITILQNFICKKLSDITPNYIQISKTPKMIF